MELPHSKLGIASTCIAVGLGLLFILMMILSVAGGSSTDPNNGVNVLNGLGLLCLVFPGLITGTVLGIIASLKKNVKKTFGIVGLCLNGLGFLGLSAIILLGMAMGG